MFWVKKCQQYFVFVALWFKKQPSNFNQPPSGSESNHTNTADEAMTSQVMLLSAGLQLHNTGCLSHYNSSSGDH